MGKKARARKAAARAESVAPVASELAQGSVLDKAGAETPAGLAEAASRLHSAALHLLRWLDREDQGPGLSSARLSALSMLVFGGPRTVGRLASAEGVTAPTMTRLLSAMEADGLVSRTAHATDRRSVLVAATDRGERTLRQGREERARALASVLAGASGDELGAIIRATDVVERIIAEKSRR